MSTALAIAATTRVLAQLIEKGIASAGITLLGSPPHVVSEPPDRLETGTTEPTQLSLFLYHVTHNAGWREVGQPTRSGAGDGIDRPRLAVDLHYLLSAFGPGGYEPQILLGLGMQALHETPFLYREQITKVFTPLAPPTDVDGQLGLAGLDGQVEMIKVTPEPLSTDDLSKLWTALGGRFRPCAAYAATVVLIESRAPIRSAPPVTQPANVVTFQLEAPAIASVSPAATAWASVPAEVTLAGSALGGPGTAIVFSSAPSAPQAPSAVGPGGLSATVSVPSTLPAGITSVQAIRDVAVGPPAAEATVNVVASNAAAFVLRPVIRTGGPAPAPNDYAITVGPAAAGVQPVTVELDPPLGHRQSVQLLLNQLAPSPGAAPAAFTVDAEPFADGTDTVTFNVAADVPGSYLVRVRVDGAESQLVAATMPPHAFAYPAVDL